MTYICPVCTGRHEKVQQARDCLARQERMAQQTFTAPRMVTPAQLDYIRKLSGDMAYAGRLSLAEASSYIDRLKKERHTMDAPNRRTTKIPMDMLKAIQPGYYAMKSGDDPYRFYRVSIPKTGKLKGCMKIQSQHSEDYRMVLALYPSGDLYWYNLTAENDVLMLAVNQRACAMDYGLLIGRCCRCGKTLTDDRSRWYGIGPECEQHWPHILDMVADKKGDYVGA